MPIFHEDEIEEDALLYAARLMAAGARTAPKTRGVDRIKTSILTGEEKDRIAEAMERKIDQKENPLPAFKRDAENLRKSPAVLLVGVSREPKKPENPLNCGACGYGSCAEFLGAEEREGEDFVGPICLFESIDLGIALGSAVKIASELNVDNRIMYTIGAAAKTMNLLDSDVIIGIPLSVTGKNIYFDRK
ncbi:MAG: ferredoxin domain-containing protein [Candidatus Geothermarchaeales archaeon]